MAIDWFGTPMRPLTGGYSGETFLVGDGDDSVVLRVYLRNPERAVVDASLLRLVRGIVPVPEVLDVRPPTGQSPAILVTQRLRGTALDELLRSEPAGLDWHTVGTSVGRVLGALSGIPFLGTGFFSDATLAVASGAMTQDLMEWAYMHRDTGRLASWSEADWHALTRIVDVAERILGDDSARTPARNVLVHSDFNPKNILVDPVTFEVTGLVDWEYAHAGSVHTDIGNFTRFERDERLVTPLVEAFVDRAPGRMRDLVTKGRAMDLWALIELAGRVSTGPVGEVAEQLLLAQSRTGDLSQWPWHAPRVDPVGGRPVS